MGSQDYVMRILDAMTQVLKPAGFRKKGLVFIAEREDVFHVVELGKGKWTTREELALMLFYGVFSPALAAECVSRGDWLERVDCPTRIEYCQWSDDWPGYVMNGSSPATVSNSQEAEWACEEIDWYLREVALPELAKRTPAARLYNALYRNVGAGHQVTFIRMRVLMDWAAAEGKRAYYGGEVLTEENFPRPGEGPRMTPRPAPATDDSVTMVVPEGRTEAEAAAPVVREGASVRFTRRKTWWRSSSNGTLSIPAGTVGILHEMVQRFGAESTPRTWFSVWFDKPSPLAGPTELRDWPYCCSKYVCIQESPGDPLPKYLELVEPPSSSA